MFNKDKIKGHNRLNKTKKGFKVSIVKDFFRKERKENNTKRNIVLGIGATAALGIGAGLLLKRKGIGIINSTKSTTKYPKGTAKNSPVSSLTKSTIQKYDQLPDPWSTPIPSRSAIRGIKLLKTKSRDRKLASSMVVSAKNMERTQEAYNSIPTEMKAIVQIEKVLARPKKGTGLGRPPERTSLKTILDTSNKTPIDKVITKAKRKVRNRLLREKLINDENVKK
jgi:hypothetical protein